MSVTPDRTAAPPANRWAVLAVLGVAQLMVVLDATIVNIALPSAQRALHFSTDSRQWVVTAYALAFGSLLLLGGKLGDLFGRKWTLIGGLSGFAIASAIGGLAQSGQRAPRASFRPPVRGERRFTVWGGATMVFPRAISRIGRVAPERRFAAL